MKTMCGSDEPHLYPVRSSTYRKEQVRADEVQRVIVYKMFISSLTNLLKYLYGSFNPLALELDI